MTLNHLDIRASLRCLFFATISAAFACVSCGRQEGFNAEELKIINSADSIMRVLTIEDAADSAVLRAKSADLPLPALTSDEYKRLEQLMIATVTHPSQDGVGIAGPQVGLNRRVVAVQRFDKSGHPFEVYPNIRIVWASDSLSLGPEGCLSVPGRRGDIAKTTANAEFRLGDSVNVVPDMTKAKFFAMDEDELNICDQIEKKW